MFIFVVIVIVVVIRVFPFVVVVVVVVFSIFIFIYRCWQSFCWLGSGTLSPTQLRPTFVCDIIRAMYTNAGGQSNVRSRTPTHTSKTQMHMGVEVLFCVYTYII